MHEERAKAPRERDAGVVIERLVGEYDHAFVEPYVAHGVQRVAREIVREIDAADFDSEGSAKAFCHIGVN